MLMLDDVIALERLMMAAFAVFLLLVFYSVVLYFKAARVDEKFSPSIAKVVDAHKSALAGIESTAPGKSDEPPPATHENADEIDALKSRIKTLEAFPRLMRESLLKSSLWLFLLAFSIAQTPVLMRYEFAYFSTQYSTFGFGALFACLALFVVNYSRYRRLRGKLQEAADEIPDNSPDKPHDNSLDEPPDKPHDSPPDEPSGNSPGGRN